MSPAFTKTFLNPFVGLRIPSFTNSFANGSRIHFGIEFNVSNDDFNSSGRKRRRIHLSCTI